ncbi:MAG: ribokinase [Candidatus Thorarchaeota archaeon]|jgi:ribokinase
MPRICNFGSINIDHVYRVEEFVQPGETLNSLSYNIYPGGKGLNQSIALAKAGATVHHAGAVGPDGEWLVKRLVDEGVSTEFIKQRDTVTGHAIIQVAKSGENAIIIHDGANRTITTEDIVQCLGQFSEGDYCLLQNEINAIPEIINEAARQKIKVAFNPAPLTPEVQDYPFPEVDLLIVNSVEGSMLSGEKSPKKIVEHLRSQYGITSVLLSLGKKGLVYSDDEHTYLEYPAQSINVVDTTAAGDTLIGYFLAGLVKDMQVSEALEHGILASALCVTKAGAADSIPTYDEVIQFKSHLEAK